MRVEEKVSVSHLDGLSDIGHIGQMGQAAQIITAIVGAATAGAQVYSQIRAQKAQEKADKKQRAHEIQMQAMAIKQMAEQQALLQQNLNPSVKQVYDPATGTTRTVTTTTTSSAHSKLLIPGLVAGGILILGIGTLIALKK